MAGLRRAEDVLGLRHSAGLLHGSVPAERWELATSLHGFVRYLQTAKAEKTATSYASDVSLFVSRFMDERYGQEWSWTDVTRTDIREWMKAEQKADIAPSTVRRRLAALRKLYDFLWREGKAKVNPAKHARGPKVPKRLPGCPSVEEMSRLLAEAEAKAEDGSFLAVRDLAILEVFYGTACRLGELVKMRLGDFDLSNGRRVVLHGKRDKDRLGYFTGSACEALRRYLKMRSKLKPETDALFVSERGEALTPRAIQLRVEKAVGPWSPHDLRRACATHLAEAYAEERAGLPGGERGPDPLILIRDLLGHVSVTTTRLYVAKLTPERLKRTYDKAHPRA